MKEILTAVVQAEEGRRSHIIAPPLMIQRDPFGAHTAKLIDDTRSLCAE